MSRKISTEHAWFAYVESVVDRPLLWESHCHARYEMIGVLEGDVTVMSEGNRYRLTEGQVVILPPFCYHTLTANRQGTYRRVTVQFEGEAIPPALRGRLTPEGDAAVFRCADIEEIGQLCGRADPDFWAPLAEALAIRCFYACAQAREEQGAGEADEFLQKAIAYIDGHLRERLTLDDLARETSRSKSSFCHLFEEKMKISPGQYILQKKMALAQGMIRDGIPPTEVALRVGYENYGNFYRIYVKQFGKSPAKSKK